MDEILRWLGWSEMCGKILLPTALDQSATRYSSHGVDWTNSSAVWYTASNDPASIREIHPTFHSASQYSLAHSQYTFHPVGSSFRPYRTV